MSRAAATPAAFGQAWGTPACLVVLCAVAWWQGAIGVLAKEIPVPAVPLVLGRCLVAALFLLAIARWTGRGIGRDRRAVVGALVTGVLLAAHWATLFMAYKVADVALVVTGVFTFPVMAALTEPWFFGTRPGWRQVMAAVLVVLGVAVLTLDGEAEGTTLGLSLAIVSAACFCARNILSRKILVAERETKADAIALMGWQTAVSVLVLSPCLLDPALLGLAAGPATGLLDPRLLALGWGDLAMVAVLGILWTAIPHTVAVTVMSRLSAATTGIVGSQQVLSGIILAWLLLDEDVGWQVVLGAGLVLGAVMWESLAKWREGRRLAAEVAEAE